jgi:uncharacterized protein YecE (DUF72 family)
MPEMESAAAGTAVRIGLCGFTISMKTYGSRFPVVEVQSTFYEPPSDALLQRWRQATSPALEYTMKVWQLVTHSAASPTYRRMKHPPDPDQQPGGFRESAAVEHGWRRSVDCARVLGATGMLFQCPASFGPTSENVRAMRRFFEQVQRPRARLLWEPRGRDWVASRQMALALCADLDLVYVVDPFVTPPAKGKAVYWRLHGPGGARNSYSDEELRDLHTLLVRSESVGPAYILFNNLPRVRDAQRFTRVVEARRAGKPGLGRKRTSGSR